MASATDTVPALELTRASRPGVQTYPRTVRSPALAVEKRDFTFRPDGVPMSSVNRALIARSSNIPPTLPANPSCPELLTARLTQSDAIASLQANLPALPPVDVFPHEYSTAALHLTPPSDPRLWPGLWNPKMLPPPRASSFLEGSPAHANLVRAHNKTALANLESIACWHLLCPLGCQLPLLRPIQVTLTLRAPFLGAGLKRAMTDLFPRSPVCYSIPEWCRLHSVRFSSAALQATIFSTRFGRQTCFSLCDCSRLQCD